MNNAPRIEQGDIVLRQPIKEDIDLRIRFGVSNELATMTGSNFDKITEFNRVDAEKWYERILIHPCKWIIEYKKRFIGVVSLRPYNEDNKAKFAIEIYDRSLYGLNIGTTVTKMVLNYAFEVKEYHKVFLRVLDYNKRAIKCYKKCGFLEEGIDRDGALVNGSYFSDIYMGILKKEFTY